MHKIIDSHCHLNFPQFDGKVDETVKRALKNGVYRMLTISTKLSEINKLEFISKSFSEVLIIWITASASSKDVAV